MTKLLKCSLILGLTLGMAAAAHAAPAPPPPPPTRTAPEVDPGLAASGLMLLGGAIAVVRARRSK